MSTGNRPLSPHLEIYRPQISMVLSISHRITGVGLGAGTLLLAYWLSAAAYGPDAFATAQAFMGSWFGRLLLFGFSYALFYHLCNGVRHLLWDIGWGFDLPTFRTTGLTVVAASAVLTIVTWIAAYAAA
ncbi:MAG: succinate dehydrogenase, cytochrome b556 subunit [Rhodobacterales bacterium]|nr:succinate dehydrogenase, cytochrome b556 subunit [Rhodobacterales bacterium]